MNGKEALGLILLFGCLVCLVILKPTMILCRCGHELIAHGHYWGGTDCIYCDCPRFKVTLLRRGAPPRPFFSRWRYKGRHRA